MILPDALTAPHARPISEQRCLTYGAPLGDGGSSWKCPEIQIFGVAPMSDPQLGYADNEWPDEDPGIPESTDNNPTYDDGPQDDVSQDPDVTYASDVEEG